MSRPAQRLINRDFRLLWTGHAASSLGDFIFETTLVVWIATDLAAGKGWAALAVSGLLAASAVPVMVVGPIAGVYVDRWADKRGVMLRANLLSAALILLLLPLAGIVAVPGIPAPPVGLRIGAVLLIVAGASAVAQFFRPAGMVVMRDVVPEADWPRASGLYQTATSIALLAGPPLAAPVLIAFGPAWALLANAGSFVVSFLCVRRLPHRQPMGAVGATDAPSSVRRDLLDGLRFFGRSRLLVALAVSLVITMLGLGAVNALDVFFVQENLGASATRLGIMSAAQGAGMLIGAVLSGRIVERLGPERTVWGVLAVLGLLIAVYARLTSFAPGVVVIFALGLVLPPINVAIGPLLMRETPRELLGRVSSTLNPMIMAANIGGMLIGGVLYGTLLRDLDAEIAGVHFGPLDSIFLGVALMCLLGALYARRNLRAPSPRRGDEPEPAAR